MTERALITILVWGLILEIMSVVYLSSTPWKFEFAYSLFLLGITSATLFFIVWRLMTLRNKPNKKH